MAWHTVISWTASALDRDTLGRAACHKWLLAAFCAIYSMVSLRGPARITAPWTKNETYNPNVVSRSVPHVQWHLSFWQWWNLPNLQRTQHESRGSHLWAVVLLPQMELQETCHPKLPFLIFSDTYSRVVFSAQPSRSEAAEFEPAERVLGACSYIDTTL